MTVYLDPASDEVRSLIAESIRESPRDLPVSLVIRCRDCGAKVGQVVDTSAGPGFSSTWTELREPGPVIAPDDRGAVIRRSGRPIARRDRHGVVALLALPPDMKPDYPALLVRCEVHGDAELDRHEVLAAAQSTRKKLMPRLTKPFTEYAYHDPTASWLPGKSARSSETRRFGSGHSREELDDLLRRHTGRGKLQ